MSTIQASSPVFAVSDTLAAAKYYSQKCGFSIYGEPVPEYAIVTRNDFQIHFIDRHSQDPIPDAGDRGGAYLVVDDPDTLFAEMQANGASIKYPPTNQFYGFRDFAVSDPFGYWVCFGRYLTTAEQGAAANP